MIGHLLSNAIKYCFGNTKIEVNIFSDSEYAGLKISNLGIKLPAGADRHKVWDFGYRGEEAIALHVNGSGIGLFTVKKIILAQLTVFSARVPLAAYLKKRQPELFVDALAK
jgi:signal transduction histidine kinase